MTSQSRATQPSIPTSWRQEVRRTTNLAVPVVLANVAGMIMGAVDTFVVGQVSATELAGVAAGNGVYAFLSLVGSGLLLGLDALISRAHGAGEPMLCRSLLWQGIYLAVGLALVLTPISFLCGEFFDWSGSAPAVVAATKPYLMMVSWSLPFHLLFIAASKYWIGTERATVVSVITVLANVVNYFADVAFVQGIWGAPALGAQGAGLATLVCRAFMFFALVAYAYWMTRREAAGGSRESWLEAARFHRERLVEIARISFPAGGQVALEVGAFSLVTLLAAKLGTVPLATHQVILTIASFTFMFPLGIAAATSVRVGALLGARAFDEARRAGWLGIGLGAGVMMVFALALLVASEQLLGAFSVDPTVIGLGVSIVGYVMIFQAFDGIQVAGAGALRGLGDTKRSLFANLAGHYVVGLPIGLYFCFAVGFGLKGLWIGLCAGLIGTSILITYYWYREVERLLARAEGVEDVAYPLPGEYSVGQSGE